MKEKPEPMVNMKMSLEEEEIHRLDRVAKLHGINRPELMRRLLAFGILNLKTRVRFPVALPISNQILT